MNGGFAHLQAASRQSPRALAALALLGALWLDPAPARAMNPFTSDAQLGTLILLNFGQASELGLMAVDVHRQHSLLASIHKELALSKEAAKQALALQNGPLGSLPSIPASFSGRAGGQDVDYGAYFAGSAPKRSRRAAARPAPAAMQKGQDGLLASIKKGAHAFAHAFQEATGLKADAVFALPEMAGARATRRAAANAAVSASPRLGELFDEHGRANEALAEVAEFTDKNNRDLTDKLRAGGINTAQAVSLTAKSAAAAAAASVMEATSLETMDHLGAMELLTEGEQAARQTAERMHEIAGLGFDQVSQEGAP